MSFELDAQVVIEAAQRQQKDLLDFQIPRLRQFTGPLPTQQNLWAELRDDLDSLASKIQEIELQVDEQRGESARKALKTLAGELKASLASLRVQSRAALLDSKKAIDAKAMFRREDLLRSSASLTPRSASEKTAEDILMKKNEDLTAALQRTVNTLQGELSRSVLTTQMLESSTQTLRSTSNTHDMLTTGLDTSKRLITALEKADWVDRLIVLAALSFFFLTVLFILKQRILDRSLRIAFWWTSWLPDFSSQEVETLSSVVSATLASTSVTASVVSSIVSSATPSLSSTPSFSTTETSSSIDPSVDLDSATMSPSPPPEEPSQRSVNKDEL